MTTELTLLVWASGLTVAQAMLAATGGNLQQGTPTMAGNREDQPRFTGWVGRAYRAHRNMLENIVLFAILVLVAQATGRSNDQTRLGAELFFWARLAYVPCYVLGLPWIRSAVWAVSLTGLGMIFLQLV
jgi:uncharacterized MAPEG superfamily protein